MKESFPLEKIRQELLQMREERDWQQFHSPRNIATSIVLEAAEILEIFQWKTNDELSDEERAQLKEEVADVLNWLILFAHDMDIKLGEASLEKIAKNKAKYPVEKSKGKATKYTKLK